jgi:hypothetical protein
MPNNYSEKVEAEFERQRNQNLGGEALRPPVLIKQGEPQPVPAGKLTEKLVIRSADFHTLCEYLEQEIRRQGSHPKDHMKLFIREEKHVGRRVLTVYYLTVCMPSHLTHNVCVTNKLLSELVKVSQQIVPLCAEESNEGMDKQQRRHLDRRYNICVVTTFNPILFFYIGNGKRSASELVHTAADLQIQGLSERDADLLSAIIVNLLFNGFQPDLFIQSHLLDYERVEVQKKDLLTDLLRGLRDLRNVLLNNRSTLNWKLDSRKIRKLDPRHGRRIMKIGRKLKENQLGMSQRRRKVKQESHDESMSS